MSSRTTRRSCLYRSTTRRCLKPRMDDLEPRALLSTMVAYPTFVVDPLQSSVPPPGAYRPAQIRQAYGFNGVVGDGSGETIAIVDAFNDPNIVSDLAQFDQKFTVPAPPSFQVFNQAGINITSLIGTSDPNVPTVDPTGGWEMEEALDVEWAHAMAPGAKIMLVEASSASYNDLLTAVKYAALNANVVSMSWGGSESSGEATLYDNYFVHAGVTFVASSGDTGAPASYPSASPNVLSVGGTSLQNLDANGDYPGTGPYGEVGWSGSGGGPSAYEPQPSYQTNVVTQTSVKRATPDVAYDADPNTGVAIYDSYPYQGTIYDWVQIGGTSAGAPQWAALLAIADQGRALSGQPALNSNSPKEVMSILYKNPADFHDITGGTSTSTSIPRGPNYSAGTGYDYVTGLGSPMANLIVGSLVGTSTTSSDKLVLTASTAETAGTSFSLTVTAQNSSGQTDTSYTGPIHFTSSDAQAVLPANPTLTGGTYTFTTVTLNTAGSQQWITATDMAKSAITGTLSGISVAPAAPTNLTASAVSSSQINLAWTISSGATGYQIQQSLSASTSTGWTQVGSTSGGSSTTFQDTGLTAGTTYYFRVIATGGSINSAFSNVASATTTGTAPTADNIWPNSYVPSENYYSYGSYELGVKFTSSVAGEVTGVRFYRNARMTGQAKAGDLWSSTGTLLATATFTTQSSSGWQQVNFSSPVAIQAGTVYIASFSTSGGRFYYTTGYFTSGGHTNGPLQALPNSSGGNGVYNHSPGSFPNGNGNGMNFWADVAFTPSSSGAARPALSSRGAHSIALLGFRSGTLTTDPPSRLGVLAPPAKRAGPARSVVGWRRTMPSTLGSVSYRRPIRKAATLASRIKKLYFTFDSV